MTPDTKENPRVYTFIDECLGIVSEISRKTEMLKYNAPMDVDIKSEREFTQNELESKLVSLRDVLLELNTSISIYQPKG